MYRDVFLDLTITFLMHQCLQSKTVFPFIMKAALNLELAKQQKQGIIHIKVAQ